MFASSGGAVTALALVAAYPDDVTTLVAHEPPLIPVLPDAAAAERARARLHARYRPKAPAAGLAAKNAMTSWRGGVYPPTAPPPPPPPRPRRRWRRPPPASCPPGGPAAPPSPRCPRAPGRRGAPARASGTCPGPGGRVPAWRRSSR